MNLNENKSYSRNVSKAEFQMQEQDCHLHGERYNKGIQA
jgi:hypothetical protein